jgi:hypothetical protein
MTMATPVETFTEIRDRIRPVWPDSSQIRNGSETTTGVDTSIASADAGSDSAFVVENEAGHLFVTGPASVLPTEKAAQWEKASKANDAYLYIQGRYVEADSPNRNLAYWSTEDLQVGQPTVANGPLNWLHSERHIIGVLTDSHLVSGTKETAAQGGIGNHIVAMSAMWKFLYPEEASVLQKASLDNALWYSMECVSETVTCMDTPGRPGCGEVFPYERVVANDGGVCSHIREKSSVRRYGDPTFLGAAVIVPPVVPGWGNADATVQRQAAMTVERESLGNLLSKTDAERMVAMVLQYANGR